MKARLILILLFFAVVHAFGQARPATPGMTALCLNPSNVWIPLAAALGSGGQSVPYGGLRVPLYGQSNGVSVPLRCDAQGNLLPVPLTADAACAEGDFWMLPVAGTTNKFRKCENGILSDVGAGTGGSALTVPTFAPAAGTYTGTQTVAITGPTGSIICYTTDGSTPAATSPGVCSHGFSSPTSATATIVSTGTLQAIATMSGGTSAPSSGYYMINGSTAIPTFSPGSPYVGDVTRVDISDSTSGATIKVCEDLQNVCVPSASYAGSVNFTYTGYIRAQASSSGNADSSVASFQGTIQIVLPTSYSDDFLRADGPMGTNWTQIVGSVCAPVIKDHWIVAGVGVGCDNHPMAVYTAGIYANNQWTSTVVGNGSLIATDYQTLVVRSSGQSTYNDAYSYGLPAYYIGVVNPTAFDFSGAAGRIAPVPTDTIELDVAGTGPVFFWSKLNGVFNAPGLDTTFNYIGGYPGLGVVEDDSSQIAQSGEWRGGSLPSFSTVANDSFQRSDDGWLGVNWWFNSQPGWKLSGNKAIPIASGTWNIACWTTPLGPDHSSRITVGGVLNSDWLGAVTRYTPTLASNPDNYYMAALNVGDLKLYARVAGEWNLLATWPWTWAAGDTLELDAAGTDTVTLTVKKNGSVFQIFSDATYHIAGTYAGFTFLGSPTMTVMNWTGGTL